MQRRFSTAFTFVNKNTLLNPAVWADIIIARLVDARIKSSKRARCRTKGLVHYGKDFQLITVVLPMNECLRRTQGLSLAKHRLMLSQ